MTLGREIDDPDMEHGLAELQELWILVLGLDQHFSSSNELTPNSHRTAGILYYFELKPGQALPVPKVYIPVRHYGKNDQNIAEGLLKYLKKHRQSSAPENYVRALNRIR